MQNVHPYKYAGDNIEMNGINIFKGKFSVVDIVGLDQILQLQKAKGP